MKKRAFSLFLAVCIIFTLLPDLLLPASAKATPDIRIKITDSTGKESLGYGDSFSDAITDSGTVAGAVYSIEVTDGEITTADWNYIKGNRASFSALRSFTVSDAVYTVADMPELTFQSCTSLTDIDIPAVETIGQYAFQNCPGLTDVGLPKATTLRDYAFYDCPRLADVALPELISAGERAFAYCSSLTEVSLPKLTSMGEHMFYNCEVLTYAEIPKVTSIGANAFKNCLSLNTLKVQGTPPAVGTDAFLGNPETRKLIFVDANGDELTGGDLDNARTAYKAADDGNTGDNLWYGWIIPLDSISLDIGNGNIEASAGLNSVISVKQSGSLVGELPQNGMITITGTSDTNKIVVDGVYADITLDDISIDVRASENACAFELKNGANADLTLSGDNSLTSGVNRAGLEVAAGQSITIVGDGSLTINYCNYGAGIGGSHSEAGGNITVLNGDITAESHSGAGIGGGYGGAGGTINISGGEITAKSYSGAGIGGGRSGAGGTINISGGIVNARSCDFGAGIGGGYLTGGGNITVSGG
ncbi:MAG: leucine-rich repeat domain-containing protein, partial [Clostridiaceae bacterium]|nr:leucine-rich repeat domain-containing protein [Clostridiaceae bacterium]